MLQQGDVDFQTIITNSSDGIIVIDQNGIVQFVNPAAEAIFGRTRKELLGTMFGFPVVAGEITELDINRKNKERCVAEMRVVAMKWDEDTVHLATLRDVTERKSQEDEIRRLNTELGHRIDERTAERDRLDARLNVIFNTTNDAILLLSSSGLIEFVNPAFNRQFGYSFDELLGHHLSKVVTPDNARALHHALQEVVDTGQFHRSQLLAVRKNGTLFDIEINISRVVNNDNHLVCNIHDISHFKAVERVKDNFVSMVNHELRTPIASLILSLHLAQSYVENTLYEKARDKIVACSQQAFGLKELVEGVLEHSRVSAQGRRGSMLVIAHDPLTNVFNELKPTSLEKKQTMFLLAADQPFAVLGNPLDFTRIWRNLVSNAIKYTPEGGKIFIRLAHLSRADHDSLQNTHLADKTVLQDLIDLQYADYLVGQVADTGYGIQPEDFDTLFERFNRGWAQESGIPGTGLGLSLVHELLLLYDGQIHVTSTVGEGSTFTFWIPIETEDEG